MRTRIPSPVVVVLLLAPADDGYRGRIDIEADTATTTTTASTSIDGVSITEIPPAAAPSPGERITGIVITNNSYRPIKSMERILEAYSSAKGRTEHGEGVFAETIGENGVGLKQGCAVLTDLSFVMMRNGTRLSMGIIAAGLQTREGVRLPSFEFESEDNEKELRSEMVKLFGVKYRDTVGECVKEYGNGSLSVGIGRLVQHFNVLMKADGWGDDERAFRVVLHGIKKNSKAASDDDDDEEGDGQDAVDDGGDDSVIATETAEALAHSRAVELMEEVRKELPRHYIHVPSDFRVNVGGRSIDFCYWQRRLVEMTDFFQYIDPITPVSSQKKDWKYPKDRKGAYPLRIFCGFDPTRGLGDRSCRLIIYSRHSGRLVLEEEDARAILGLSAGSSEFAQGLTILVDDMHGHLPLNPTKQDVAFGEQSNGNVHKKNLYTWIGAITYLYYNLHYTKGYGKSKRALTQGVALHENLLADAFNNTKSLDSSEFTNYDKIEWKYIKSSGNIRCGNLNAVQKHNGADTLFRFDYTRNAETNRGAARTTTATTPRGTSRPSKKRKIGEVTRDGIADDGDGNLSLPTHDLMAPGSSLQAALQAGFQSQSDSPPRSNRRVLTGAPVSYAENDNQDYKALYEGTKASYEELKEKYGKKKEYKAIARALYSEKSALEAEVEALHEQIESLKRSALERERKMRLEHRKERESIEQGKDAIIERLRKRNKLLEERATISQDEDKAVKEEQADDVYSEGMRQCDL